jgi:hypothetical protein
MGKPTNTDFDPSDLIDNEEEVVNIDTDRIDNDSLKEAAELVENLKDIYADPEFMKANPKFATRLKAEVENLRILMKIRKSDEVAHDVLLGAIGRNSSNASLYRSLSDIQRTILSTTSELSAKVKDINAMLKNIQLELNFKQEPEQKTDPETGEAVEGPEQNTFRGSKDFIKQMRQEMDGEDD